MYSEHMSVLPFPSWGANEAGGPEERRRVLGFFVGCSLIGFSGDKALGHLGASRMLMAPWASPEGQRGQRTLQLDIFGH